MLPIHKLDEIRRELTFDRCFSSCTSKIWVFYQDDFAVSVLENHEQVLHIEIHSRSFPETFHVSVVYAKSTKQAWQILWTNLAAFRYHYASVPWMVGGDFNVIQSLEEYSGSSIQDHVAIEEFNDCIASCELFELLTVGEEFTWGATRRQDFLAKFAPVLQAEALALLNSLELEFDEEPDIRVWKPCKTGSFSIKTAYEQFRRRKPKEPLLKNIWNQRLQMRISLFMWRLRNLLLPFPETLRKIGLQDLWKLCYKVLFEGVVASGHVLVRKITNHVSDILRVHVMPSKSIAELEFLERHFHIRNGRVLKRTCIPVSWMPPLEGSFILNIDGSSRDQGVGYGFIIRGRGGLLFGLRKCEHLGLHPVLVQTNNKVHVNIYGNQVQDDQGVRVSSTVQAQGVAQDPLSNIGGLMTQARSKRMRSALNNLISNGLAQENVKCGSYKPKIINVLQGPFEEGNFGPQTKQGRSALSPNVFLLVELC
ncbi:OLC1v1004487C1 [Oldenlandia corymbosa var. corymbosa]|uniref:OLC1v1004487C1 n=1 Tax=Oldenlandia corymbosa var. corymbosa TaxID=529605 RepID=A0AAV1DD41_OLDCO|nr:OLC1v1004487C1 [Oldenlandia corymbosa var. corymbosa]